MNANMIEKTEDELWLDRMTQGVEFVPAIMRHKRLGTVKIVDSKVTSHGTALQAEVISGRNRGRRYWVMQSDCK